MGILFNRLGRYFGRIGYSVNESVVVFDRIRENFRKPAMRSYSVPQVIDNAITATMSRTIITHGSTEAMVLSMLIFGGAALHGFAMALTIGIVFGIYSSVLVASPLLLMFGLNRENISKHRRKKKKWWCNRRPLFRRPCLYKRPSETKKDTSDNVSFFVYRKRYCFIVCLHSGRLKTMFCFQTA